MENMIDKFLIIAVLISSLIVSGCSLTHFGIPDKTPANQILTVHRAGGLVTSLKKYKSEPAKEGDAPVIEKILFENLGRTVSNPFHIPPGKYIVELKFYEGQTLSPYGHWVKFEGKAGESVTICNILKRDPETKKVRKTWVVLKVGDKMACFNEGL